MEKVLSKSDRYAFEIAEAIERWNRSNLRWGKDDCLMGLADIVKAVEGIDVAAKYRRRYRSAAGAIRVLGKGGVPGAVARAAKRLGWEPVRPAIAPTGSLGLVMTAAGPAGAIAYRDGLWITRAPLGFMAVPKALIFKAWGYECLPQ